MNGMAFAFLRTDGAPIPLGDAGHIGWGFQVPATDTHPASYYAGATENVRGLPFVAPGGDTSWWGEAFDTPEAMFDAFRTRRYDSYKVAGVRICDAVAAQATAEATGQAGYIALSNNCLDHVWRVLKAYGVDGLPFAQFHPAPNAWFAAFNGEFHNLFPE